MNNNRVELSNAERDNKPSPTTEFMSISMWLTIKLLIEESNKKKNSMTNDMQIFPACLASFV